jgi:hypothetical protein
MKNFENYQEFFISVGFMYESFNKYNLLFQIY